MSFAGKKKLWSILYCTHSFGRGWLATVVSWHVFSREERKWPIRGCILWCKTSASLMDPVSIELVKKKSADSHLFADRSLLLWQQQRFAEAFWSRMKPDAGSFTSCCPLSIGIRDSSGLPASAANLTPHWLPTLATLHLHDFYCQTFHTLESLSLSSRFAMSWRRKLESNLLLCENIWAEVDVKEDFYSAPTAVLSRGRFAPHWQFILIWARMQVIMPAATWNMAPYRDGWGCVGVLNETLIASSLSFHMSTLPTLDRQQQG